ncbi:MAG: hypothetical protein IJ740_10835 [Ruminococcus sp.]|nr:hypothetical protein [Ruminococcus sp.]
MKTIFENYRQNITDIENRIGYITSLIRSGSGEDTKALIQRRDILKEEYNDMIMSLHEMVKYVDDRPRPSIRREV